MTSCYYLMFIVVMNSGANKERSSDQNSPPQAFSDGLSRIILRKQLVNISNFFMVEMV